MTMHKSRSIYKWLTESKNVIDLQEAKQLLNELEVEAFRKHCNHNEVCGFEFEC